MKCHFKNFYFTCREDTHIIYDYERNRIISYSKKIDIDKIIDFLSINDNSSFTNYNWSEEEKSLCQYLKDNVIDVIDSRFSTFDYLEKGDFKIPSASFMVAQNCNLSCTYCYGGKHGQYNASTLLMSESTAKKAIRRLVQDNKIDNIININFFGGEPLINFKLIMFVVEECKKVYPKNKFSFSLTTNATLINKSIAIFFKENDFRVLISIDGYEKIHNYHRKFSNGKGSFARVLKGIEILKECGVEFRLRSTLDHKFYSCYFDVVDFLAKLGGDRVVISRLINYEDEKPEFSLNVNQVKEENKYLQQYLKKTVREVMEGKYPRNFPYLSHFKKIVFAEKSLMSCGAYEGGTAISSDGKFYPCHRFVGMKDFEFGEVNTGVDKDKLKKQTDSLDNSTKLCLNCFGKYICQRACIRDLSKSGGKFIQPDEEYCNLLRETVDDSLIIYYKILQSRPDFFNTKLILEVDIS